VTLDPAAVPDGCADRLSLLFAELRNQLEAERTASAEMRRLLELLLKVRERERAAWRAETEREHAAQEAAFRRREEDLQAEAARHATALEKDLAEAREALAGFEKERRRWSGERSELRRQLNQLEQERTRNWLTRLIRW
jgi:chromosome segregation ATPase